MKYVRMETIAGCERKDVNLYEIHLYDDEIFSIECYYTTLVLPNSLILLKI